MTTPDSDISAASLLDALASIETYLNPAVTKHADVIGAHLAAGRLVVIRDAFQPAFAERTYRSLHTCTAWQAYEKYDPDFHYHHHNVYKVDDFPADLAACRRVFDGHGSKALMSRLSGRDCRGPLAFSASWYLPGDHSLPHTDAVASAADANRQVAFVWHLAKDWRSEWGGALFWCPRNLYLAPRFNTLVLFNVGPDSFHFVTTVSPYAESKRLTVNGWWTGPNATGAVPQVTPERVEGLADLVEIY